MASDKSPAWSPDGRHIVFLSSRRPPTCYEGCDTAIYVMDADGSNQEILADTPGYDYSPQWSPDGSRVLFGSTGCYTGCGAEVYSWSPNGSHIAFATTLADMTMEYCSTDQGVAACNYEVFTAAADGTDMAYLNGTVAADWEPVWSPDGLRIAYESTDANSSHVYLMDADGSNQARLTANAVSESAPSWSPDGNWLAYICGDVPDDGLCVAPAGGGNGVRLTDDAGSFAWLPDGSGLLCSRYVVGTGKEMRVVNVGGSGAHLVLSGAVGAMTVAIVTE